MNVHVHVDAEIEVADEHFDVIRYVLVEALGEPSRLDVEIVRYGAGAEQPDPAKLVGQKVEFHLKRDDGSGERFFYGFVAAAERMMDDLDVESVRLEVVSELWRLGKRQNCKIFQNLTTEKIARALLAGAKIPEDLQDWLLSETYAPRVYCVQYRETDLEFLQRLLAEEGIWLAVHMKDGKGRLVFGDDPKGTGSIEGQGVLRFDPSLGFEGSTDTVIRVGHRHSVRSDKVQLRDYDFTKPKVKLKADAEGSDEGEHSLEVYEWPGRYTEEATGSRYARVLLEALQSERELVEGETGVISMRPGERFSIEDHPYEPLNQEHVVVSVRLEGSRPRMLSGNREAEGYRFSSRFSAIPKKSCKLRPARRERAQKIPGLQTAITTGPSTEEIHVDEHGQVRAQFHWDRLGKQDENSSVWMRTSQLATGGSMLLPRTGWEVVVCCREGDADKPYVMSRLYNAEKRPPYDLPKEKGSSSIQTATTPGGGSANEVKMGDSKGSESMLFNASFDMNIDVNDNTTSSVKVNLKKKVGGNQKLNVTDSVTASTKANQLVKVGGNQSLVVQTYMTQQIGGSHTLSVGGKRSLMIGGDHRREVATDSTLNVTGNHYDLTVGDITDNTLANFNHSVGAALVEITTANRAIVVGAMNTENTAAAKIIGTYGSRGVTVNGAFSQNVGGALIFSVKGNKSDAAGATYTELAAGAQFVKATNIVFEAESMLTLVMGASIITLMPGMIMVMGTSAKLDGNVVGKLLTIDN